jgi:hypothetical protein
VPARALPTFDPRGERDPVFIPVGINYDRTLEDQLGVFERFPDDDGGGVWWSVVHAVEGLDLDYEPPLRDSLVRQPSRMGTVPLGRLERSQAG